MAARDGANSDFSVNAMEVERQRAQSFDLPPPSSSLPIAAPPPRKHRPGVTLAGSLEAPLLLGEPAPKHTVLNLGGLGARAPLANLGSPTFSPELAPNGVDELELNDFEFGL